MGNFTILCLKSSTLFFKDVNNVELFADKLYQATRSSQDELRKWGRVLFDYTRKYDIDYWIKSFVDPSWTSAIVPVPDIISLEDLSNAFQQ